MSWPSGQVDTYGSLASNRVHTLVEGRTGDVQSVELKAMAIKTRVAESPSPSELNINDVIRNLKPLEGVGEPIPDDQPRIVVFFSLSCISCKTELMRQRELEREAAGLGARILWVTLDSPVETKEAFHLNQAPTMPFQLGTPVGSMPVPTVYLVDGDRSDRFTGRFAVTAALDVVKKRMDKK